MDTLGTSGLLDATRGKRGVDHDAFEESKRRLHGDLHAYLRLSLFPDARVRWHSVESVPPVYCDGGRIAQVLSNLVGNALKFTPRGGSVIVTVARAAADDVRFSVHDTGVGILEEAVPHVFERFWQNDRHRARGTGLGLYIAKGIIDAHHGRIWVTSRVGEEGDFQFTVRAASWPEEPSYGLQVAPAKPAMT